MKKTPVVPAAEQPNNTQPYASPVATGDTSAAVAATAEAAKALDTNAADEPAAEQPTERELQLQAENEQLRSELDAEIAAHVVTAAQHDELIGKLEQYEDGIYEPADEAETTEPGEYERIRELLTRNSLKKAWLLADGPCFDEQHARHVAGADFDALEVISAE